MYRYLKEASKYPAMVLDIRGNPGGSVVYWKDYLLPYLVGKNYSTNYYNFIKEGPLHEHIIEDENYIPLNKDQIHSFPISKKVKKCVNAFDCYKEEEFEGSPSKDSLKYKRKIYLLVDSINYSGTGMLAEFCKENKIATLVGEPTLGGGVGSDPNQIALPNTGYVVRYIKEFGFSETSSITEFEGTEPDYVTDKALDKVIDLEGLNINFIEKLKYSTQS